MQRLGLIAIALGVLGLATSASLRGVDVRPEGQWNNLKHVKTGDAVRVVLNDGKSYAVSFQAFSDEAIVVRTLAGEQTFSRQDVLRVSAKRESHRMRNALIAGAAGGGAGVGIVAGVAHSARHESPYNNYLEGYGPYVGAVLGGGCAGLAAALSGGGWEDVYRAP